MGGPASSRSTKKRYKRIFAKIRKSSVEGDSLAPTEVVDLFEDDNYPVVDIEINSKLMAHCVNESICANFVDKHPSIVRKTMFTFERQVTLLGELLYSAAEKTKVGDDRTERALMDEQEATKKFSIVSDAQMKKENGAL
ncbi:hypothetical protein Fot_11073 [Forsythia ovata]|uniref:Uncharacterized protein n=1 Tax=Forsythia ovata TaxID=205694 RepID=A0ABD1WLJ6_9LAMI